MRLHEYSVFARFRYNDLKVGISSGNQALNRCAFHRTNVYERLLKSDVNYRFVIDMASLR